MPAINFIHTELQVMAGAIDILKLKGKKIDDRNL
jgi:hypothetical protein